VSGDGTPAAAIPCASRRAFCAAGCRMVSGAAAAIMVGSASAGAAQGRERPLPTVRGEVSGSSVRVAVGSTPLARSGGVVRVISNAGSFLVARTGTQTFTTLSATCSHEACLITDADGEVYVCPCHGSRFDRQGQVLTGPAELPLYEVPHTFADDVLTIRV
jgi:Rieske Fe-S protein